MRMNFNVKRFYSNIGNKVCKVAKVCGAIGIVCAIIGLICLIYGLCDNEMTVVICGASSAVLGIVSLISSWPLYAFGQITNDVHAIRSKTVGRQSSMGDEMTHYVRSSRRREIEE